MQQVRSQKTEEMFGSGLSAVGKRAATWRPPTATIDSIERRMKLAVMLGLHGSINPRNLENLWYSLNNNFLTSLTAEFRDMLVVPQFVLWLTDDELDAIKDRRVSLQSTASSKYGKVAISRLPDFVVIFLPNKIRRTALKWPFASFRRPKISKILIPILMEVKRRPPRGTKAHDLLPSFSVADDFKLSIRSALRKAAEALAVQASLAFKRYPHQRYVLLIVPVHLLNALSLAASSPVDTQRSRSRKVA